MRMFEDSEAQQPEVAATSDSESERGVAAEQPSETFKTPAVRMGPKTVQELDFGYVTSPQRACLSLV